MTPEQELLNEYAKLRGRLYHETDPVKLCAIEAELEAVSYRLEHLRRETTSVGADASKLGAEAEAFLRDQEPER